MLPSLAVSEDSGDERTEAPASASAVKVLVRPVAERRVIVLAPSEGVSPKISVDWKLLAKTGISLGMASIISPVLGALDKDGEVSKRIARKIVREVAKVIPSSSARSSLESLANRGALVVAADVAERELAFPPGHPRIDHAYAAHPLQTERYLPVAAFHQQLFEQKASELVTLLAALGAERVTVRAARGYRKGAGFSLGASLPIEAVSAHASASRQRSIAQSLTVEETFVVTGPPRVPEGLVWYPHEPSWQALARRRIEFGTSTFRIELTYDEDFGVDGGLVAALEGVGVQVGGSFRAFERTCWEFEGTFAPIAAQEHP
jgi:hypothetical protein